MWWLTYRLQGEIRVVLLRATSLVHARLSASIAGLDEGEFAEGHELPAEMVKRIPKTMVGRALSRRQAQGVIRIMEAA